jgi:hypothetical protein
VDKTVIIVGGVALLFGIYWFTKPAVTTVNANGGNANGLQAQLATQGIQAGFAGLNAGIAALGSLGNSGAGNSDDDDSDDDS